MSMSELLGTAALVAGLLMAIAPALQIRRMLQTRSSRDYSLGYPALLSAGFVLWLAYGISIWNPPMIITNIASLSFMMLTIGVALRFRRAAEAPAAT